jgi:hypothetical protein
LFVGSKDINLLPEYAGVVFARYDPTDKLIAPYVAHGFKNVSVQCPLRVSEHERRALPFHGKQTLRDRHGVIYPAFAATSRANLDVPAVIAGIQIFLLFIR